jgi:hypothetical protein
MTMASLDYYRLNLNRDERGEVPEGFSNIGGNIEISLDFLERPFYQHYLPSVKLLRDVFSVLKSPTFDLKLFRASPSAKATTHSGEERGDLEVETFERPPNAGATLRFYRSTGRVAVVWRDVELPRNTWKTNGRIAGISDLGASSMEIQLKYRSRRLSGVGQDMIGTEIEPDYVPPFDPLDGIQVICVCLRFDSYLAGISSGNRTRWVIFRVFCPSQTTFWKVILASVLSISL